MNMPYIPYDIYPNSLPTFTPYARSCCGGINEKNNVLELNGKGSLQVNPTIAVVSLGVVTDNKDLTVAEKENTLKMSKVLTGLKDMGIADKDIKTQTYNIDILYDYVEGKQIFKGYRVTNILSITIRDINAVGKIIDNAVENGANAVHGISFTVLDPSLYYRQCLKLAIKDAVEKAEVVENSLGIFVNKTPIKITEETYGYAPIPLDGMVMKAAAPIMPGQSEITANIKAIFSYRDI